MGVFDRADYWNFFKQHGYGDEKGASLLLRTKLLMVLVTELNKRNWTQQEAAEKLGVKQPRISEIYGMRVTKFSIDLLVKYLFRLGKEVDLDIFDAR